VRYWTDNGKGAVIGPLISMVAAPQPVRLPKGHEMKAFGILAATAIALALFPVVATTPGVAEAAPCAGLFANPTSCQNCLLFVEVYHTSNVCDTPATLRPAQPPTSVLPVQTPEPALPEPVLPEPAPTRATPAQTLQVVPPSRPSPKPIPAPTHGPIQPTQSPWWPVALGYGVFAIAVALAASRLRI
jgi:hypothetical protein